MNDLKQRASEIDWWHSGIELGYGIVTQGRTFPAITLLPALHLPDDLRGKSVIDVCAWDGYMAFTCEERGASRVVAVDSFAWDKRNAELTKHKTGRNGFDLAFEARESRVMPVYCDVLDLDAKKLGTFDIVLFLGVLYHMRHPLLALEKVAQLVAEDGVLIVESHIDMQDADVPAMCFYPGDEVNNDSTNWWGPNVACIEAMLHDVGMAQVEITPGIGRATFHARRVTP